jgi:hypothetical protein
VERVMIDLVTPGMFGSKVRIDRAVDFLNQMVIPDYQDFLQCKTDVRLAFHSACSLFHLRDWIYCDFRQSKRWTTKGQVQSFLESKCADFRIIRDVANASKHLKLDPRTAGTSMTTAGATFATITRNSAMTGYDSTRTYQGGSEVLVTASDDDAPLRFAVIAKNVLNMWRKCFEEENWQ